MSDYNSISSGQPGIDNVIDGLRLGDNVVWQTADAATYASIVAPFVARSLDDGRKVIYFRYGEHAPITADPHVEVCRVDPSEGFEVFSSLVYQRITTEGTGVFYVFDPLTELLRQWGSDLMVMNFFRVTCPYLHSLDTIAYFDMLRGEHSFDALAEIRETSQLLLDVHVIEGQTYVQPHKAWGRYSPSMFFPHLVTETGATPVTNSAQAALLFGTMGQVDSVVDPWRQLLQRAEVALVGSDASAQRLVSEELIAQMIGTDGRMPGLAERFLGLDDLLRIARRRIGSGRIGGKSVGMLVASKIATSDPELAAGLEPLDSYFLGSDLFFTYLIDNGWWTDWMAQKEPQNYYSMGKVLCEKLASGRFGPVSRERFLRLLEYFGQSPIIVRSSSLLEDNFGNAFSGKYESVFCANQGSPEQRLHAFEDAVRVVYSSVMGHEALNYRQRRGLIDNDEQMAILVQRVSGDHHGRYFFPNAAGVGNSQNLYVFSPDIDPAAGALRLVAGLGTRAVDRLENDYAWNVPLDRPTRSPVSADDLGRYTQRLADVLDLQANELTTVPLRELSQQPGPWHLFLSPDRATQRRLRELGRRPRQIPQVCDHAELLRTGFPDFMRRLLDKLATTYDYPVDIEFTVNILPDGSFRVALVQCRPLQTRGVGTAVTVPNAAPSQCLISSHGFFMGGNLDLAVDQVLYVDPQAYLALSEQDRYQVARIIGKVNDGLEGKKMVAIAPGRWGSSTTALGVPAHFAELNQMSVLVEFTDPELDLNVDLSFGSHFFQDLVETGIFFVALDQMRPASELHPELVTDLPNLLADPVFSQVIHVADTPGLHMYADVVTQQLRCAFL